MDYSSSPGVTLNIPVCSRVTNTRCKGGIICYKISFGSRLGIVDYYDHADDILTDVIQISYPENTLTILSKDTECYFKTGLSNLSLTWGQRDTSWESDDTCTLQVKERNKVNF